MNAKIQLAKVKSDAILPSKRQEDAGYDVYTCFSEQYIRIMPHETRSVPTGIASAFSSKYYIQLCERGSSGIEGIALLGGVIDSGYRGEWFVTLTNTRNIPLYIAKKESIHDMCSSANSEIWIYPANKAICQALLLPVPKSRIVELSYEKLKHIDSLRKNGKLGSSSK